MLKICCNHYITSELDLKPMPRSEGKAWIWYAMDFTEGDGKMEQLAVRFRDVDIAHSFKTVFDDSKEKMKTPSKGGAAGVDPSKASSSCAKPPADVARKLFPLEDGETEVLVVCESSSAASSSAASTSSASSSSASSTSASSSSSMASSCFVDRLLFFTVNWRAQHIPHIPQPTRVWALK